MQQSRTTGKLLLQNTKAEELFPENRRSIVTVKAKDKITVAFKTLIDNKILSAPVYNVSKQKFIGFIDMVDIVDHVLNALTESEFIGGELPQTSEVKERFANNTCDMLMDISKRNPYLPVEANAPILKAIELMVKWKVHRIPIVDRSGELTTVISQTTITGFLHKNMENFPELAAATVESMRLGYVNVVTVNEKEKALDAFHKMREHNVSAVGVVNDEGTLTGNVSVSDLKQLTHDVNQLSRLFMTVTEFRALISPNNIIEGPICVVPSATFEEVVTKLILTKVHRIYVVDNSKPIGVISQYEVLKAIIDSQ